VGEHNEDQDHDVDPYEGMTNQDVDPVDEFKEMREAEYRQDAADEAAAAEREQQDRAAEAGDPDDECDAEFIDGSYYGCGHCETCKGAAQAADEDEEFYRPTDEAADGVYA
jgi:Tfp pilus assembly protein PilV